MGCDIHPYIEQRINGQWVLIEQPNQDHWASDEPSIYARNYDVFAILADVRNGKGFAGVRTGDGFNPISSPRGLPDDLSEALSKEPSDDDFSWLGDHSFGYLTFREIFDYDYTQTTIISGVVDQKTFKNWDYSDYSRTHAPCDYSGGIWGSNVCMISNDEMREKIKAPWSKDDGVLTYYTEVNWKVNYMDVMWPFLYALKWAAPEGVSYDDLRLVFGFDS